MVLPAGMAFSIRISGLSNSSGSWSLLVMTSTNGVLALTVISSGWNRLFSMVRAISVWAWAESTPPPSSQVLATARLTSRDRRRFIARSLVLGVYHTASYVYLTVPMVSTENISDGSGCEAVTLGQ